VPGIAITIEETVDPELVQLFAWRDRLQDAEFQAQWRVAERIGMRVLLHPGAPEALVRLSATITRPQLLERRFIFLAAKVRLGRFLAMCPDAVRTAW
jgi:hypothetical protein